MTEKNSSEKKPFVPKQPSPFNADPYNNRGGKKGNRGGVVGGAAPKIKAINAPKFKGGSGGDR